MSRQNGELTRAGRARAAARVLAALLVAGCTLPSAFAQQSYTWQELHDKFLATNPTLQAAKLAVDESKAEEITAYLRPNPDMTATLDQLDPFTTNPYRPLGYTSPLVSFSYLHERQQQARIAADSARQATLIADLSSADQERTLLFNLRAAFVQTLQAKSVLRVATENLAYCDQVLAISSDRFKAGDIAQVDLDRLELQRVQFESDLQTAAVNLRTAKIQLLTLLNDRTPVEQFDVTGPFDFAEQMPPLDEFRKIALDNRPDLKAAAAGRGQGQHRSQAGGGQRLDRSDVRRGLRRAIRRSPPTSASASTFRCASSTATRARSCARRLDIRRNERLREAAEAQVFSDVDSAYVTLNSNIDSAASPTRPGTCNRRSGCARRSPSPISTAARRCWIF